MIRVKNIVRCVLIALCCAILPAADAGYADAAAAPLTLTATPNTSGNSIDLKWAISNTDQKYSYMLYSKSASESSFQTIPAKNTVKVLNVYPDAASGTYAVTGSTTFTSALDGRQYTLPNSALLKDWMEAKNADSTNGYGKGLISVDAVPITAFNANPDTYLKNASGYKYDVVFFGAWDGNGGEDLSATAEQAVDAFTSTGRGLLLGHDTCTTAFGRTNFIALANKFVNIISDSAAIPQYGSTQVQILKKGLLTDYPWNIGDVGTILNTPMSHTLMEFASGDIWMNYPSCTWNGGWDNNGQLLTNYEGKTGTNNFYLTTWNNAAMIQTGHSKGQATSDEQKVLANTIFYLAQITTDTSWSDHKGQDLAAPNAPTVSACTHNVDVSAFTVNYAATDNASSYQYYVEATGESNGQKYDSPAVTASISTGIKGYSVVVDNSPGTVPNGSITTTSGSYTFSKPATNGLYVHIRAVDNAGNVSAVTHYHVDDAISVTCPTSVSYTINPDSGSFTAPEIPITNNSNIPLNVYIQSFKAVAGGVIVFNDVLPNKYANWNQLTAAQTQSDIALALAVDSGTSPTAWAEIDLTQPVYSAQITSPVLAGVLNANSTGYLALSAKYGRAWAQAVTAKHQLVLTFKMQ